jgi:hypothetical protein
MQNSNWAHNLMFYGSDNGMFGMTNTNITAMYLDKHLIHYLNTKYAGEVRKRLGRIDISMRGQAESKS